MGQALNSVFILVTSISYHLISSTTKPPEQQSTSREHASVLTDYLTNMQSCARHHTGLAHISDAALLGNNDGIVSAELTETKRRVSLKGPTTLLSSYVQDL